MGYIRYVVQMIDGKRYSFWAISRFSAGKMAIAKAKKNGSDTRIKEVMKYSEVYEKRYPYKWGVRDLKRL